MPDPEPILRLALRHEFERLHPMLQRQYSVTSQSGVVGRGKGLMTELTRGRSFMVPFLKFGARRFVLFPESGKDIGFSVENYAYVDAVGRETLTWTRVFEFDDPRRFDEYLIYSERRKGLVIYAGSHQHLAVDLKASVDESGALCFVTGQQRLYELPFRIPFPKLFTGIAKVRESYSDELERYEIEVTIDNKWFGHIIGYKGWFHHALEPYREVPQYVFPKRTEPRD